MESNDGMILAKLHVSGVRACVMEACDIPRGIVGGQVEIMYDDPMWDSLIKTVVVKGSRTRDIVNAGERVTVPAECVDRAMPHLYIGVYGTDGTETIAIPTLWADLGPVHGAADPSGEESTEESLPVWAQILSALGDLSLLNTQAKDSLVAAINEALTKGGGSINQQELERLIDEYLAANPPSPGRDGEDGEDGLTPHIGGNGNWYLGDTDTGMPSRGEDGAVGPQGAAGPQGDTGATGAQGEPGKDGTSATHSWNGTVLTVTSASGTSSADLKGEKGDKGDAGEQGVQGETGPQGPQGERGDTGATGAAGKDGVDGKDYVLTDTDRADIAALVIEMLGGNPVFGIVDEDNNIIVSGNLADGTYSVKYEMEDGSTVDIGDLILDSNIYCSVVNTLTNCTSSNGTKQVVQGGSYSATITANSGYELSSVVVTMGGTDISASAVSGSNISIANVTGNIVITALAEEKTVSYTNLADPASSDWGTDVRIGSDGTFRTGVTDNIVTNYIKLVKGDVVRVKGLNLALTTNDTSGSSACGVYNQNKAVQSVATFDKQTLYFSDISKTENGGQGTYIYENFTYAYIRFAGKPTGSVNDIIITVNEPIE